MLFVLDDDAGVRYVDSRFLQIERTGGKGYAFCRY
ncbi:hypothetical protein Dd1591_0124 [Dickeya chrysanthemi Ech1591]|uniref:Uncharacterized protein n=1 Tax=Dickeya chrysanthemi (strain Ech1591) TaxID=561229 RepID=C6CG34_DICC1|nr:hypothetical protein Dd1591_0124 [Dickeya chrysanthemi Ech1591]